MRPLNTHPQNLKNQVQINITTFHTSKDQPKISKSIINTFMLGCDMSSKGVVGSDIPPLPSHSAFQNRPLKFQNYLNKHIDLISNLSTPTAIVSKIKTNSLWLNIQPLNTHPLILKNLVQINMTTFHTYKDQPRISKSKINTYMLACELCSKGVVGSDIPPLPSHSSSQNRP